MGTKLIKNKMFLRGVGFGATILCAILIFISGYVYVVVNELELKIKETLLSRSDIILKESILEKDTRIYRKQFNDYLIFSKRGLPVDRKTQRPRQDDFHKQVVTETEVSRNRKHLYINTELILPGLEENTCDRNRCVQIQKKFPQIPSSIWKGLLGTEDFRFLEHQGVDPIAITRAIIVDLIAMKFIQGGSTLTQQLVKNLFLTNEKKLSRKIREMVYAIYIENILEKEEIITLYLNEVFWGTFQGVYLKGYHAASLAYFNKSADHLDEFEATILIGLLKGPNYYRPSKGIQRLKDRSNAVFKRLQGLDLVTNDKRIIWTDEQWSKFEASYVKRSKEKSLYSYYLVSRNQDDGLEPFEKFVLYQSIEKTRNRLKERTKDTDVGIKILLGSKECDDYDCPDSFSYYSKFERDKRKAMTGEYHQVGSLLKPIVYDAFIDLGRKYDDDISTKKLTLNLKSGPWSPRDYSLAKTDSIKLKKALQKSKNIPLIRIASEVGFENLEEILSKNIPNLKSPLGQYPAQLLGAIELSLSEVFQTYNKFIKTKCEKINNREIKMEDSILQFMSVAAETTISRLAKDALKNAFIFGKTGTTNNGLDNWYFAFDGKQIYVIWFGVDSKRSDTNLRLTGAISSFMIFQDFINNRGKLVSEILCD